jgi:hypothetical protein
MLVYDSLDHTSLIIKTKIFLLLSLDQQKQEEALCLTALSLIFADKPFINGNKKSTPVSRLSPLPLPLPLGWICILSWMCCECDGMSGCNQKTENNTTENKSFKSRLKKIL